MHKPRSSKYSSFARNIWNPLVFGPHLKKLKTNWTEFSTHVSNTNRPERPGRPVSFCCNGCRYSLCSWWNRKVGCFGSQNTRRDPKNDGSWTPAQHVFSYCHSAVWGSSGTRNYWNISLDHSPCTIRVRLEQWLLEVSFLIMFLGFSPCVILGENLKIDFWTLDAALRCSTCQALHFCATEMMTIRMKDREAKLIGSQKKKLLAYGLNSTSKARARARTQPLLILQPRAPHLTPFSSVMLNPRTRAWTGSPRVVWDHP